MKAILIVLTDTPSTATRALKLRNGSLYKHIPSGLVVRVRSHSALKAAVTHHSDNATVVLRSTLTLATETEWKGYLAQSKVRLLIAELVALLSR